MIPHAHYPHLISKANKRHVKANKSRRMRTRAYITKVEKQVNEKTEVCVINTV